MDMGEHDPESEGREREAGRQSEGEGALHIQGEKIKARRE